MVPHASSEGYQALGSTRHLQVVLWVREDAALSHSDALHMENAGFTSKELIEHTYIICLE